MRRAANGALLAVVLNGHAASLTLLTTLDAR